ncbi:MAG TPA: beta-ketoacyl synthase N-terminal-like domain-containing protein [Gammaproteobacteria bacterium]|nr:beta-ketoacyl synthase N-terminal-like domain-containing protein [Gammaproteobacteria bacterium]
MTRLPVIIGFGGVGPAGRSSGFHAYRRTVLESLPGATQAQTLRALAAMMGLVRHDGGGYVTADGERLAEAEIAPRFRRHILDHTLIRRLERQYFDADRMSVQLNFDLGPDNGTPVVLSTRSSELPDPLPAGWRVLGSAEGRTRLEIAAPAELRVESHRKLAVQSAGQVPTGFDPAALYASRFHPRGLQMTIVAASDAVKSVGIDWSAITARLAPDAISVYAASAMAQLDQHGTGGMLQARLRGGRVSSKQLPLGLNTMPADFVNAYVLGNVGCTGAIAGACASFLYNLRLAVEDIQSGRRRLAVVGNAEAPLVPEVIEGYNAMSALATDDALARLDGGTPDHRRASRPFGENCGFVLGESGQYFVLCDDALALELGADIYGAVPDVFVNADGYKKSISSPGPGNYITLAKAVAAARGLLGEEAVRRRSFVQAHGSSTPQNRVTESRIFDEVAKAFGIHDWPVTAIKAFVGHSLAPASADQLVSTLGVFRDGLLPGIKTTHAIAADVHRERLNIVLKDLELGERADVAFLNSKGFGGNNATGTILSPVVALRMLEKRHGAQAMKAWLGRLETTRIAAAAWDEACCRGPMQTIYRFGDDLLDENQIEIDAHRLRLPGIANAVDLDLPNRYEDMV